MNNCSLKKATALIDEIKAGKFDATFEKLYLKNDRENQKKRYLRMLDGFIKNYGDRECLMFSAPGRTEVIGNHTDHQNGLAIAGAVNIDIIAAASPCNDGIIRVKSEGRNEDVIRAHGVKPGDYRMQSAGSIIAGMSAIFEKSGHKTGGFCAYTVSDVPVGSGLSSSAAFETMLGTVINRLYNKGAVSDCDIAKYGKYAENEYFGKPCGLMDQAACSVGGLTYMDFRDGENPAFEKMSFKPDRDLFIISAGGSHNDLTDDYAAVPFEMNEIAKYFGKEKLRFVNESDFFKSLGDLREKFSDRAVLRAFHFFNEIKRVQKAKSCIENSDCAGFYESVGQSGDSSYKYLQNIYSPKNPKEQGIAVALALCDMPGVTARVHGGGFAGTVQAYADKSVENEFTEKIISGLGENSIRKVYFRDFGGVTLTPEKILQSEEE